MIPNELKEEVNSLSLAIFKVAESVDDSYLRGRIKVKAVDLIEACFGNDDNSLVYSSAILRSLIFLACKLGFISELNRRVISDKLFDFEYVADSHEVGEVDAESIINSREKEEDGIVGLEEVIEERNIDGLSGLDSKISLDEDEFSIEDKEKVIGSEIEDVLPNLEFGNLGSENVEKVSSEIQKDGRSKADERKEKILETVRREGICFLRDLAAVFPGYSERTLRYDLEKLIAEKKVEKIGSSGPGTFYRSTARV